MAVLDKPEPPRLLMSIDIRVLRAQLSLFASLWLARSRATVTEVLELVHHSSLRAFI